MFAFLLILLLKKFDFEKKSVQFAIKYGLLLAYQNLQEVNLIFKMVASIGLLQVRIRIFGLLKHSYFMSDLYQFCGRMHGLLRSCISDSHALNVVVPFNKGQLQYLLKYSFKK